MALMAGCNWPGWWRVNGWLVVLLTPLTWAPNSQPGGYKRHPSLLCQSTFSHRVRTSRAHSTSALPFCCPRSGDLSAQEAGRAGLRSCALTRDSAPRGVEGRSSFWGAHPCATARCCRTTTSWWRNCTANICTASTVDRLHRTGSTSNVG